MDVVLTNTVALIMLVSKTAETNNMKCKPKRTPRTPIRPIWFRMGPQRIDFLKARIITTKTKDAIIKRQNAIDKTLTPVRKRMNMAAVPKNVPAIAPSKRASLRLLLGTLRSPLLRLVCGSVEQNYLRRLKSLGMYVTAIYTVWWNTMSRTSQSEQAETRCSSCGKTDMETTLIPIRLKGKDQWICAKCLPELIHGPNRDCRAT